MLKFSFQDEKVADKVGQPKTQDVLDEVARHTRGLSRKEDLAG